MKESSKENIALIGSGNVSWHLAHIFQAAGHQLKYIYSRNESSARDLSREIPGLKISYSLDFSSEDITFLILAVPDAAIEEILNKIKIPEKTILLHTSGSFSLSNIKPFGFLSGVLYPLQTFTTKRYIYFKEVPILIEASDEGTLLKIRKLANSISNRIYNYNSEQRQKIHISAVFASNFTNYLFQISDEILKKEGIEFNLLKPLIFETMSKAFEIGPIKAQTGPALRGDQETLENHLRILDFNPNFQEIYHLISNNISKKK